MWFAVGPALSGLGLEGLPKALFAIRPQGWRDEPRRYEPGVSYIRGSQAMGASDRASVGSMNLWMRVNVLHLTLKHSHLCLAL